MDRNVAVVGCAQSKHEADMKKTREEMVFDVSKGAIEDAGITREDLDTVINASNDLLDGRTISNVHLTMPEGAYLKDESKVEEDGAFAMLYGLMRILSGTHDVALIVGNTQSSTFNPHQVSTFKLDPTFDEQVGLLNDIACAAIQARKYMIENDVTEEQIAEVSVKNLKNASDNPNTHRKMKDLTVDEVLESELLYDPIRELMSYPRTDGACAVVLASEEIAKEISSNPVWIKGIGSCQDSYLRDRGLSSISSLRKAGEKAYEMADLSDAKELDVLEVSEKFAHEELMAYEALGLCGEGDGGAVIDEKLTDVDGEVPVNPSGGVLSANPVCATGLIRIAEAFRQVQGNANGYQVSDVDLALAHGQSGLCAQTNIVFVLGGNLDEK